MHQTVEQRLGYSFKKPTLLERALTHRSFANEQPAEDNELLALLGDAVLQLVITAHLVAQFPGEDSGTLTEKRKNFVCEERLVQEAKRFGLGEFLLLGRGEKEQGGSFKSSLLSEAFEALIGALFLDGGLDAASRFLTRQFDLAPLEGVVKNR